MTERHLDWQALITIQPALSRIPPRLRMQAEHRAIEAGETLGRIGDRVQSLFAVISGEVRLIRRSPDGTEVILQRSRGGFLAEASLDSTNYHCDVVVSESGTMLSFPIQAFRTALDESADFRGAWMNQLACEIRKLRAQCERLSLHGAAQRILHYIESEGISGGLALNQSRKAWAAELGLSHEALYRTLSRLQADGVLSISGEHIVITKIVPASHGVQK